MNDILNAALEYLELGFSVIPVDRKTKKPLIAWKKYQAERPTEEDVETWFDQWPDANVAVVTGKLSNLVAVDADSDQGIAWVTQHMDHTTVYSRTGKGLHALYAYPPGNDVGNRGRIAPDVDIRGEGGYIVVPPSIHATGKKYEWVFTGDGWDDLPVYRAVNGEVKPAAGNLNVDLTTVKSTPVSVPVDKGKRNVTLAQLAGSWFAKGLDEPEALVLARDWNSRNNPPMGDKELVVTVRSIHKTHREHHPDVPETPGIEAEDPDIECRTVNDMILCPGGVLQDIMAYIERNSPVSVPLFSLGAALSFLGAVMGQKVMTETGLRTNLYCISLGYSGSGKNAPFNTLAHLMQKSTAHQVLGPSEVTSAAAILSRLGKEEGRNTWIAVDEIGQILRGLHNPNAPEAGIPRLMTKLFSSTDRGEVKGFADPKKEINIPWHHLAFFGATTPERFWESIGSGEVADGFLARVLVFESLHDAPLPKYDVRFDVPQALIDKVSLIHDIPIDWHTPPGNIEGELNKTPIPNRIPMTDTARKIHDDRAAYYHDLKNQHKKNTLGIASIYARAAEHAMKVALVHTISTHLFTPDLRVEDASVTFAWELIDAITDNTIRQVENNVSDSDIGRIKQKIKKGIRAYAEKNHKKYGVHGARLRDLQRGPAQGIKSKELKELLTDMVLAEQIGKRNHVAENGKSVEFYYVAK